MSFNKTILVGNLTRDPELRVTPGGTALCQFSLAVNHRYKDGSGAQREDVLFMDVEAWAQKAELVGRYLTKGSQCLCEGRLKMDSWEDKATKQKRSKIKLVLDNVVFLGSPRDRGASAPAGAPAGDAPLTPGGNSFSTRGFGPTAARTGQADVPPKYHPANDELDEDVPF